MTIVWPARTRSVAATVAPSCALANPPEGACAINVSVVVLVSVQFWYPPATVSVPIGGCGGFATLGPTAPVAPSEVNVNITFADDASWPLGGGGGGIGGGGGGDGGGGGGGEYGTTAVDGLVLLPPHTRVGAAVATHMPGEVTDTSDSLAVHSHVAVF